MACKALRTSRSYGGERCEPELSQSDAGAHGTRTWAPSADQARESTSERALNEQPDSSLRRAGRTFDASAQGQLAHS